MTGKPMKLDESFESDESVVRDAERLVEALVFASPHPISEAELRRRLPRDVPLGLVLERLQEFYRDRGARFTRQGRSRWFFDCREALAGMDVHLRPDVRQMPQAAQEVLAQIVWGQPMSLAAIDERRGVRTSPATMRLLIDGGWIQKGPRLQEPGDPVGWITTPEFLERIHVDSLGDLPDPDELERGPMADSSD